nr:MAG TPA: hypothetical protein [Caudoviricetes sp.]
MSILKITLFLCFFSRKITYFPLEIKFSLVLPIIIICFI